MAKIILDINDEKLPIVSTILENLKTGLINNIEVQKKQNIQPVSSSIGNNSKRYVSKEQYKQRLNKKILEDEFLPKTSSNKYLSKDEFKRKLKGI